MLVFVRDSYPLRISPRPSTTREAAQNRANFRLLPKEREGQKCTGRFVAVLRLPDGPALSAGRQAFVGLTPSERPFGVPACYTHQAEE
ncbi:MAG: hypothetical protein AMJ65_19120 [Phycisphaerae bacterium SG8_4]|nr:MAG: hypothetical protein AMJ65_19120 [Phycisphaerae bacterium SG8_4]